MRSPRGLRTLPLSLVRVIVAGLGAFAVLGVAAGPALAKSDISIAAGPLPGKTTTAPGLIDVVGWGADDAGGFQRLCVDRRIGTAPWRKLACGPVGYAVGGLVHVDVPRTGPGPESFRARLLRVRSAGGDQPVVDRVSRTVVVSGYEPPRFTRFVDRVMADWRPVT
jgi:hypothetical protein